VIDHALPAGSVDTVGVGFAVHRSALIRRHAQNARGQTELGGVGTVFVHITFVAKTHIMLRRWKTGINLIVIQKTVAAVIAILGTGALILLWSLTGRGGGLRGITAGPESAREVWNANAGSPIAVRICLTLAGLGGLRAVLRAIAHILVGALAGAVGTGGADSTADPRFAPGRSGSEREGC
jgi:hypothetical protein